MIVLLGASGYIGQAFELALKESGLPFKTLSRRQTDYTQFETLRASLRAIQPDFLINAAGYTGTPNVDACETAQADTLQGNTLFPQTVAHACTVAGIPWGHVSSGCIYSGAKIMENGVARIEMDLTQPALQALRERQPEAIRGYAEVDEPNFTFRRPPCSFYSGTKALGEEAIGRLGQSYIWRLRIPFDEWDHPRNYLSKIQRYPKVYDNINSISHRGDFVKACLDLWLRRAPFGIYNLTNPGYITTRQVAGLIQKFLRPERSFEYWANDAEFYRCAAKAPRSNCVLDTTKLHSAGVRMPPVEAALEDALRHWKIG